MRFTKSRLADVEQAYSIVAMPILGESRVIAAPEGPGPVMAFTPPSLDPVVLVDGPGGCMGFAAYPGRDDAIFLISDFYPIYQSERAGVDLCLAVDGLAVPWARRRVFELPFVHRICTVGDGQRSFLLAASICGGKTHRDDWSQPGTVYAAELSEEPEHDLEPAPVLEGIHHNHGMHVGTYRGERCVYIAADEGLYALRLPTEGSSTWPFDHLLDEPISEPCFIDLDGDGALELAVIEPFHGNAMSVYKERDGRWERVFSSELSFGHGMWTGDLAGAPTVIVANRSGNKDLVCLQVSSLDPFTMEETIIDAGSGTTNVDVLDIDGRQVLVAANAAHAEYAKYEING